MSYSTHPRNSLGGVCQQLTGFESGGHTVYNDVRRTQGNLPVALQSLGREGSCSTPGHVIVGQNTVP